MLNEHRSLKVKTSHQTKKISLCTAFATTPLTKKHAFKHVMKNLATYAPSFLQKMRPIGQSPKRPRTRVAFQNLESQRISYWLFFVFHEWAAASLPTNG
jgi:hypothetical protein